MTEALALLGILLGATAQSATGMGFSLLAAPVLVLHLGPREGVSVTLVLAVLCSAVALLRDGRDADAGQVTRLLVPTLLCTPVYALALKSVDAHLLALASGGCVVLAVGLLASGVRWPWLRRPEGAVAAGASSALLNVVGGVGGPPIGLYAANAEWGPAATRGNLCLYFLVQNAVTLAFLGFVLPEPFHFAALAGGTAAGLSLGRRMPARVLRTAVLGASLCGGLGLIGGAV
ncbi:TSUP family transporter [Spirillospora albida]|uniref:TSUP family transporter n=1 Tax=Spirillospora albida TaxID=58123 RepID=UPI00068C8425|nr:TSUP family transporter [Spirillospora albida]